MGRVVTIIAINPEKEKNPLLPEGDNAIESVIATLGGLHSPPHYYVARASVIQQIPKILSDAAVGQTDKPDLVQIIGHGEAGLLSLGGAWTGARSAQTAGGGTLHYVLDSDPYAYQALMTCVSPPTKVWLLGCEVGGSLPGTTVADGPTLLFDLAELWNCEVSAPIVSVNPLEDFNSRGRYRWYNERMIHAKNRSVSPDPALTTPWPVPRKAGTGARGYASAPK